MENGYPALHKSKRSLRILLDNGSTYGSLSVSLTDLVKRKVSKGAIYKFVNKPDYDPTSEHLRRAFGLPHMKPAPACPHCGEVPLKKTCGCRRNGTAPARKRTPPIRIGEATDEELEAIKQNLTTDERREALVEAANNKRRS